MAFLVDASHCSVSFYTMSPVIQLRRKLIMPAQHNYAISDGRGAARLMWSQNATTLQHTKDVAPNRSQFATGSQKHRDPSALPLASMRRGGKLIAHDAAILTSGRDMIVLAWRNRSGIA